MEPEAWSLEAAILVLEGSLWLPFSEESVIEKDARPTSRKAFREFVSELSRAKRM